MDRKAFGLIIAIVFSGILVTLSAPLLHRAASENFLAERYEKNVKAFWFAEGGVNRAIYELRKNFYTSGQTNLWSGNFSYGSYSIDVSPVSGFSRTVTSHGYAPVVMGGHIERILKVGVRKSGSTEIFGDAIYSAGDVDLNGNSYSVTGNIRYAGDLHAQHTIVDGEITYDPTINPLAMLDFETLRSIAYEQGNLYDAERLSDHFWEDSLPSGFWCPISIDGIDNDLDGEIDEPYEEYNVVYIEDDLALNGNFPTMGGFIVVAGDIITDYNETDDMIINGNGQVNGVIYTRGEFRVNGGAGNINIDGGVICGTLGRLNGNTHITYNAEYMGALERSVEVEGDLVVTSWEEG